MDPVRHNHSEDTTELLSAYSDGAVDIAERKRAEEYIERCPACAREIGELRVLKSMLRELPAATPMRSFTIDPATAPRSRWQLFPTLRFATLLSAVLLFVVLGVDVLGGAGGPTGGASSAAVEPAAEAEQRTALNFESAQPEMGVMAASAAAEASTEAAPAPVEASAEAAEAAAPAEASAEASTATDEAAGESAEASEDADSKASAAAASAIPPANAPAPAGGETGADQSQETEQAAASEAASGALTLPGDAGYIAPPAESAPRQDSGGGAAPLNADEPASADTLTSADQPAGSGSFDTLRVVEVLLALAAVALGLGALWARRTGR